MFEKVINVGVLSLVAVGIALIFGFLTVASVLDVPGIKDIDNEQLISTTVTLTAALGGAAAARFGGKGDGGNDGA